MMTPLYSDFANIIAAAFDIKDAEMSRRNVAPKLNFNSMRTDELKQIFGTLNDSVKRSKVNASIVAVTLTAICLIFLYSVGVPVLQVFIVSLIVFTIAYYVKAHAYWRLFFSSSTHFYMPIRAKHLYGSMFTDVSEMGIIRYAYLGWFLRRKTANTFAKANGGLRMNEKRAKNEMQQIFQILNDRGAVKQMP